MEASVAPEEIAEAIVTGEVELVRAWLDNGGDVNAMCPYSRSSSWRSYRIPLGSLLIVAARYGKPSIMELLLTRGADVDATDRDGRTAVYQLLNCWTNHRSLAALRVLLSHGADVNLAKTARTLFAGRSPLMNATSVEGPDIIRLLLRAGADPEHRAHDFGRSISTAEEQARSDPYCQRSASADLLRDVRLAGGWWR